MKYVKKGLELIMIFLLPLLLTVLVESIHSGSFHDFLSWRKEHSNEFLVAYMLSFGVLNVFYLFGQKIYYVITILVGTTLMILDYISQIKWAYRGEDLLPVDLKLGNEAKSISSFLTMKNYLVFGSLAVALIVLLVLVIWKVKKSNNHWIVRMIISLMALFFIVSIYFQKPMDLQAKYDVGSLPWDQKANYQTNGFELSFILNMKWLSIEKPKGYSQEKMEALKKQYGVGKESGNVKPNIIFVMTEAFWDPTRLTNVKFNRDPIPYFRQLQKDYTSGNMISNVFGGGTSNTEFEAITGYSTNFLPSGVMVYMQYMDQPMDSMAVLLGKQGYHTTGVHTSHGWFYHRNDNYKTLGFNNFIGKEFFSNPEYKGPEIYDKELAKRVISEIKSTKERDYVYAISMESHAPYYYGAFPKEDRRISVEGDLSKEAKETLETYAEHMSYADDSLKYLVEQLNELNEPTIVVFYGDHLPALGANDLVYNEANYFDGKTDYENYLKRQSVPFVIWDNFSNKKEKINTISPSFFAPYILQRTNLTTTPFIQYQQSLIQKGIMTIPNQTYWNKFGLNENDLDTYKLFQYDGMFGKEYASIFPKAKNYNPSFYLGSGKIKISDVSVNGNKVHIKGQNFVMGMRVLLNGNAVMAEFVNDHEITMDKPDELNTIQLQVIDSQENAIASSNVYQKK